jgi:uncharacterized membrane-anchored protein
MDEAFRNVRTHSFTKKGSRARYEEVEQISTWCKEPCYNYYHSAGNKKASTAFTHSFNPPGRSARTARDTNKATNGTPARDSALARLAI